jgi:hypothetical protein
MALFFSFFIKHFSFNLFHDITYLIHNVAILCFLGLKTWVDEDKNMMTTYKRPIIHFPKKTIEIIMSSLEMFEMCLIQV